MIRANALASAISCSVMTVACQTRSFEVNEAALNSTPMTEHTYNRAPDGFFHTYEPHPQFEGHKFSVFIPKEYRNTNARYSVMYMNDGQSMFFQDEPDSWEIGEVMHEFYAANPRAPHIIVVAIHPVNRSRDYTHAEDKEGAPAPNCCGVDGYASFVARKLKPFIDQTYRTFPDAEHNAVVGASFGGLAALHTGLMFSNRFGFVFAMSPSFWLGGTKEAKLGTRKTSVLRYRRNDILGLQKKPNLYFDYGSKESIYMSKPVDEVEQTLIEEFKYPRSKIIKFVENGAEHNQNFWRHRFYKILQLFVR